MPSLPDSPMQQKVGIHSNLANQDQYTTRKLPRTAQALCDTAEANGWAVRVGWSLVAIPAGYRESNHHKVVEAAYLMEVCGVQLAAYRSRAWSTWHLPVGTTAPKSVGGSQGGQLWVPGRFVSLGVASLIAYIQGEMILDD